jgi:hypothetical protein
LQRNYYENTVEATIRLSDVISARGGWLLFNSVDVLWAIKSMQPRRAINMFYVHNGPFHDAILEQRHQPQAFSCVHSLAFQ